VIASPGPSKKPLLKSGWIRLKAGNEYFVEILMQAGVGADNLKLGWEYPGQGPELISSSYFRSYVPDHDDTDEDGLADVWEQIILGAGQADLNDDGQIDVRDVNRDDDFDGDGISNGNEYLWALDPVAGALGVNDRIGVAGMLTLEIWNDLPGGLVSELTGDPSYPAAPDQVLFPRIARTPLNFGDNYGVRLRGRIIAPASGNYVFTLAADYDGTESGELWLGTDGSEGSRVKILDAASPDGSGADPSSGPVTLEAGREYYLELVMKAGEGRDGIEIAWAYGGMEKQMIPVANFRSYVPSGVDTDGDGLTDEWEIDYFGNLGQTASDDPDNDGLDNAAELAGGTDPGDAGDPAPPQPPTAISINVGGNGSLAVGDAAGVLGLAKWNDFSNVGNPASSNLTDSRGNLVAGFSFAATGANDSFNALGVPNKNLMSSWMVNPTVQLSGIPYRSYKLIVYYDSWANQGAGNSSVASYALSANGVPLQTLYGVNKKDFASEPNVDPNWDEFHASTSADANLEVTNGDGGFHFVFEGLGSPYLTLAATTVSGTPASICGFQIVADNNFVDSDSDGLPDTWEITNFGDLTRDGTGDADSDGHSDLAEYEGASDPNASASIPGDIDGDGLPDTWETTYFGNLNPGASDDPDNDGLDNAAEFAAGSNPSDPNDPAPQQPPTAISFNIGGNGSLAPGDAAGVLGLGNWNDFTMVANPVSSNLMDSGGTAVPGFSFAATGANASFNALGTPNKNLMASWMENPTIRLAGIPYRSYKLIVYYDSWAQQAAGNSSVMSFALSSNGVALQTLYGVNKKDFRLEPNLNPDWDEFHALTPAEANIEVTNGDGGFHLVFEGLGSPYLTLAATTVSGTPASICGFQIVADNNFVDSDSDGLPDTWEITHFGDLTRDGTGDADSDGHSDLAEYEGASDPNASASIPGDIDGDGLPDTWEAAYFGDLNEGPSDDSDNDGLDNATEFAGGSDPSDSDDPGIPAVLLGAWNMEDGAGLTAADSSANGADGTLVGDPQWMTGIEGAGALQFDGVNAAVTTPVTAGASRTLAAWFYPLASPDVPIAQQVFDSTAPGQSGTGWGLDDGMIKVTLGNEIWNTGQSVEINRWQHIAVAFDLTKARLYFNGQLVAALSYPQKNLSGATFQLGRSASNPFPIAAFDGRIDDARIYENKLTDAEVAAIYLPGASNTTDSDFDGLADAWEQTLVDSDPSDALASIADVTPAADLDGDGLSNLEEHDNGTDPLTPDVVPGAWSVERWENMYYDRVADLVRDEGFYGPPSRRHLSFTSSFQDVSEWAGVRLRGRITAPASGYYHFWLSCRNSGELWLSEDSTKYRKRKIAELSPELGTGYGVAVWDGNRWDHFATQMSEPVYLEEGQSYFIEMLSQQGHVDGQHVSIAWATPGGAREPLPLEYLESYALEAADGDDDYLPDAWELQYGLDPNDNGAVDRVRQGERGDYDLDGLSNRAEYLHGTDPTDPDTDQDGISDREEIEGYGTDPTVSDAPAETVVNVVTLDAIVSSDFDWTLISSGLISNTFRGAVEWEFTVPTAGDWLVQIRSGVLGTLREEEIIDVDASIDGTFIGRHALRYGADHANLLRLVVPNLSVGTHRLALDIDNYIGRRTVIIKSVEIREPFGPDANGDGRVDWIASELSRTDFITPHPVTSATSPFCLEGHAMVRDAVTVDGSAVRAGGGTRHWFVDLPLDPSGSATSYSAAFGSGLQATGSISWLATNVLQGGEMIVRQGDSLRLGAWLPDGSGTATIQVSGGAAYSVSATESVVHTFSQPGSFTLEAIHSGGTSSTMIVEVMHADLPEGHIVLENSTSPYRVTTAQADRALYFEGGDGLELGPIVDVNPSAFDLMLYPAWGGTYGLLARLYEGGPILDVVRIEGVGVSDALQNELTTATLAPGYPGYIILSTPLVVKNLPPGGSVVVDINRGGVSFLDGTKQKIFHAEDFENGLLYLQFLAPSGLGGGYCHSLRILDAEGNEIQ
jgi:hypothetical protein